jgi:hypothetical protein
MNHIMTIALVLALAVTGCAHTSPEEMSADEHRGEALRHLQAADREVEQYDPGAEVMTPETRTPFYDPSEPIYRAYNVTEHHLRAAEQHLDAADEHREAARTLERWESEACADVPPSERAACPLITGSVRRVEELGSGVRLVLREGVNGERLASQMNCHLAFSRARGFETPSCPLYVRGAEIRLSGRGDAIEVWGDSAGSAAEIRRQARALFAAK